MTIPSLRTEFFSCMKLSTKFEKISYKENFRKALLLLITHFNFNFLFILVFKNKVFIFILIARRKPEVF